MNEETKVIDDILARLFITTLKIEEKAIAMKSERGLTISEVHVLKEIGIGNTKTMTQVANGLHISVGALTTAINKLVEKGYVSRERDKADKRIVNIRLTDAGRIAFTAHERFHIRMVDAAVSTLTDEEKTLLTKSLVKLDEYFLNELEKVRAQDQRGVYVHNLQTPDYLSHL